MKLLGFLLLVGVVILYWKWIVGIALVVLIVRAFPQAWREHQQERQEKARRAAAVVARADQQHAQVMAGDVRGVYGIYTPAC